MIIEGNIWLFSQLANSLVCIPSFSEDIRGDLGLRSYLKTVQLDQQPIIYSERDYYLYSSSIINNINFVLYYINSKDANPIYSDLVVNSTTLRFLNHGEELLQKYSVGDKVYIEEFGDIEVSSADISNNQISFSDVNFQNGTKYKIIHTEGSLISINERFSRYSNHKLKFGGELYVNT